MNLGDAERPDRGRTRAEFSSKCAACGEVIEEGDQIALDDDGNWVHELCLEEQ